MSRINEFVLLPLILGLFFTTQKVMADYSVTLNDGSVFTAYSETFENMQKLVQAMQGK